MSTCARFNARYYFLTSSSLVPFGTSAAIMNVVSRIFRKPSCSARYSCLAPLTHRLLQITLASLDHVRGHGTTKHIVDLDPLDTGVINPCGKSRCRCSGKNDIVPVAVANNSRSGRKRLHVPVCASAPVPKRWYTSEHKTGPDNCIPWMAPQGLQN